MQGKKKKEQFLGNIRDLRTLSRRKKRKSTGKSPVCEAEKKKEGFRRR